MKKSNAEKEGYSVSAADRGKEDTEFGKADSTLDYYGGSPDQSPLYKALLTSRLDSTNSAYDKASSGARLRAKMGGFGYETPVGQGAQTEIESQRAGELAKAPNEALLETVPYNLQAAGMRSNIGKTYGDQASSYFDSAANAEARRKASLMSALSSAGMAGAAAFGG